MYDLNISDFEVEGGAISNLQVDGSGLNYSFDLHSSEKPNKDHCKFAGWSVLGRSEYQ